ncbi:MAG: hypothetical protein ABJA49_17400, partial [Betaproteobacteria bacterium]
PQCPEFGLRTAQMWFFDHCLAVLESHLKKFFYRGAVLLCLPLTAMAQSGATDPATPVPSVLYRSVFTDTPKGVETESLDWRAANAEVGKNLRGHMDILKWEAAKAQAEKQPAPAGAPSSPGAAKP